MAKHKVLDSHIDTIERLPTGEIRIRSARKIRDVDGRVKYEWHREAIAPGETAPKHIRAAMRTAKTVETKAEKHPAEIAIRAARAAERRSKKGASR